MKHKRIYLDMDGVIADFVKGALAKHGVHIPYPDVRWDFWKQCAPSASAFWAPLGFDFWRSLDPTPEFDQIVKTVFDLDPRVVILSSPCKTPGCVEGKTDWLSRHLPGVPYFFGSQKQLLAAPGKFLLDDHDPNLEAFYDHGGHDVPVGRPWNKYGHMLIEESLESLRKQWEAGP